MPTIAEYVQHFGLREAVLVIVIAVLAVLGKEGWRLMKDASRRQL